MTFPTIPTAGAGQVLTGNQADTTATRTFPDRTALSDNAGDLLIAIIVAYQTSTGTDAAFSGWTGGFTEFHDSATSTTMAMGAAYKWSTGGETGTFAVTQAGTITGHASMIVLCIPGAHASTPPEAGGRASVAGASSNAVADATSLNPAGWDVEDTLWIAVCGAGETSGTGSFTAVASAPTDYGDYAQTGISQDAVGGTEGAVAFRQNAAASEDPGTFTADLSNSRSGALVIAVRPAAEPTPKTLADTGSAADTIAVDTGEGGAPPALASFVPQDYVGGSAETSVALPKPSGIGDGSTCIAAILNEYSGGTHPINHTPPASGGTWTLVSSVVQPQGGSNTRLTIFEYRAGVGETSTSPASTWTFTWTNGTYVAGATFRISGANASGSFFDSPIDHEVGPSASATTPAVQLTTAGDDRLLFWMATAINGNTTWTEPADFTEVFQGANITAAWKEQATAGDTGALTGTNGSSADLKGAFLGAVKPAGGATPKTLADTGAAADTLTVAAAVALAQSGQAADTLTVAAAVPLTQPGSAADAMATAVPITLAQSGSAADTLTVAAAATLAQSGSAADTLTVDQGATPKTLTDQAAAADSLTAAATVTLPEQAAAADAVSVDTGVVTTLGGAQLGTPAAQPGTFMLGTILVTAGTTPTLADSGAASDSLTAAVTATAADQAAAADTLTVAAAVTLPEQAAATDALTVDQGATPKTLTDQGATADSLAVTAQATLTDGALGADTLTAAAQTTLTDSGQAADAVTVDQGVPKALADQAASSDSLQVAAAATVAEVGTATDQVVAAAAITLTQQGSAQDALSVPESGTKTFTDSGAAADNLTIAAAVPLADSGIGADARLIDVARTLADAGASTQTIAVAQPRDLADSGAASDVLRVAAAVPLSDLADAAERLSAAVLLTLADQSAGADTLLVSPVLPVFWAVGTATTQPAATGTATIEPFDIGESSVQPVSIGEGRVQ